MRNPHLLQIAGLVFLLCVFTTSSPAQTFTTLATFSGTNGSAPLGNLVQGADGNFYGTTSAGGNSTNCLSYFGCGTIFKVTPKGVLTTLYDFSCTVTDCVAGYYPNAGLVLGSNGNFYGTTQFGGTGSYCVFGLGCGFVFEITPAGVVTPLYQFCSQTNCPDGWEPEAGLTLGADGNFYGTTSEGGVSNNPNCKEGQAPICGTVFKITLGGVLTTLYSFQDNADGRNPFTALVQDANGNFFGTTAEGGSCNLGCGVAFEITPSGTLTPLADFGGADGEVPFPLVRGTDGNLYGTTQSGGTGTACGIGCGGTVFQLTPSGALTVLHQFCSQANCVDGSRPEGALIQGNDGNFYGTTSAGGTAKCNLKLGCGTIFKISPSGTFSIVYNFCNVGGCPDGKTPQGALLQVSNGVFYGTASAGSRGNTGTVFAFDATVLSPTFAPSSLNFGNQAINTTSSPRAVQMTNPNANALSISSITASAGFAISSNNCGTSVGTGKRCSVSVTFTPTKLGTYNGKLSFVDAGPNSPQTISLSGAGTEPAVLTPSSATYATYKVGTTSPAKVFHLANNLSVTLIGITIATAGDFAVSSTTCTASLSAKGNCSISVTFTPTATGTRTGQLKIADSAGNSPQTATLTGTGD